MQRNNDFNMIVPVILAGGIGSRLWPLSRQLNPKQFVSLTSPGDAGAPSISLFRQTLERLQGLPALAPPIVICHEEHRFLAAEQLRQAGLRDARIGYNCILRKRPSGCYEVESF